MCLKKRTTYFLVLFFCSCTIKKLQIPTEIVSLNTGEEIKENSIRLEKGKICYIYSSQYDEQLFSGSLFKNQKSSNFMPAKGVSTEKLFNGAASRSAKIDTILNSNLIVYKALQEALLNIPVGFQYHYIPQSEFVDIHGNINTGIIREKYNPDIIVNLESLSLKMTGDANRGYSVARSEPKNMNYGLYSYATTTSNFYGNILMDYTAVWEIQDLNNNSRQSIKQSGRYVSSYYKHYSIEEEITICAKKIGEEFSNLLEKHKT